MAGRLSGKLAFVTGAGSGIGRATCGILSREGACIIAADKDKNSATETINIISKESSQRNHLALDIDVADNKSIQSALKHTLLQYNKPPSVIVNSAGITRDNFLLKLSEQDFDQVINVNLKGTFMVIQIFVKSLIEHEIRNASVINIGSIVGKYGNIGQANYSSSKAGVEALTKVSAKEFGKFGIRVNCILPGIIVTPMTEVVPDKVKEKFLSVIPLARLGKPEEVGEVIAFLASENSSYVNGASIDVTGGY